MSRCWALLPLAVVLGVPLWTDPSELVIALVGAAGIACAFGIAAQFLAAVTGGGVIATIGYAAAAAGSARGADAVAAAGFGLALLYLLDLSEMARRTRGVAVAPSVLRAQTAYWFARTAAIAAAAAGLLLCAAAAASIVPGAARAVVAGIGAVVAFAGAARAGLGRRAS